MKLFLAFVAAVPLCAQCTYTVNPPQTATVSYTNASGQISVTASATYCSWTYASDSAWLTFNGQAGGQAAASFTISYAVTANTQPSARTANVTIADSVAGTVATIAITQQASPCSLSLPSPAYETGVGGGSSSFAVQSNCIWNSWSNANWITVTSGASGVANGTIGYSVAANACVAGRSGSLTVEAGSSTQVPLGTAYPYPVPQFTVNQDGSASNLTFTPAGASFAAAGGAGILTVSTGANCSWSAYSDQNWITISSTNYGNGPGPLGYTVSANTGAARTGYIHIGTLTFSVTQQAAPAPTPQIAAVDHSASYVSALGASGAVAPGEIVSLFGSSLGPSPGVSVQLAANGAAVTTSLGGAQVLFDGKAAPLIYASSTQVNAVVPFEVSGKTTMTVIYQQGTSAATILNVQAANPGIYTLDGSGSGPGAILNQDSSINGVARPAARGSVVQIYLTGGGVTNPPSIDASITPSTPPLPYLLQNTTVTIGGLPAIVDYWGGAPGYVAGLVQVNATVPAGVTPGASVPVLVTVGSWTSQTGVTIAVN
ncbi:MAG: BACON domain-containing protein [Bryobacteraceae bacterium]